MGEVIEEIGGAVFYMAFAFILIHESDFFMDCELSGIGMSNVNCMPAISNPQWHVYTPMGMCGGGIV